MAIAAAGGSAILVTAIIAYRRKREPGYLETAAAATAKSTKSTLPDVNKTYYLDYNGTTPVYPQVFHSMVPYLKEHFGNPSSGHVYGKEPRRAIDEARHKVLHSLLGVTHAHQQQLDSLWFCGCGTEADNLAIHLALQAAKTEKPHVVTSNVEHPAIELYLKALENEQRIDVTYVPVDKEGRVSATDMIAALTEKTILVTLMLANNESGALQPVPEVSRACRQRGILFHTDAAQAAGKVSVQLNALGNPDMVTLVGHKIGAPKGIAALYVRPGCLQQCQNNGHVHGLLLGGGQEFGMRGGTENTPYIVGMGTAAELAQTTLSENSKHMEMLRSRLLQNLQQKLGVSKVQPNGPMDPRKRLPNTLSVGFDGIHSGQLLASIGDVVAASAGATCHSTASISTVLRAMQVPESFARGTLRLSVGPSTTKSDVDEASEIIAQAVKSQWKTMDS
jgi:cysteine desulfurase